MLMNVYLFLKKMASNSFILLLVSRLKLFVLSDSLIQHWIQTQILSKFLSIKFDVLLIARVLVMYVLFTRLKRLFIRLCFQSSHDILGLCCLF